MILERIKRLLPSLGPLDKLFSPLTPSLDGYRRVDHVLGLSTRVQGSDLRIEGTITQTRTTFPPFPLTEGMSLSELETH